MALFDKNDVGPYNRQIKPKCRFFGLKDFLLICWVKTQSVAHERYALQTLLLVNLYSTQQTGPNSNGGLLLRAASLSGSVSVLAALRSHFSFAAYFSKPCGLAAVLLLLKPSRPHPSTFSMSIRIHITGGCSAYHHMSRSVGRGLCGHHSSTTKFRGVSYAGYQVVPSISQCRGLRCKGIPASPKSESGRRFGLGTSHARPKLHGHQCHPF